ncbi:MAG: type II toxin-antitoxin system VapC family toxin [Flammeovirgaceae bacterium]|nr:type II toxin-antitoxin system VapC family toxin [Flammeovirgaceae bacterium]
MIVVDTNIIAYLTFQTEHSKIIRLLYQKDPMWQVPLLWKSEFLNVISIYYRKELITFAEILEVIGFAQKLTAGGEHEIASMEIIEAIMNCTCSSYDCEFIVLAKRLNTKLITYDKQILKEFPDLALKPEDYLVQHS